MLTRTNLRALVPGKWARTRVPDWNCWKEPGTNFHPGEEVDVCVMPRYEPRYDYPNHWDWFYSVGCRRAGNDYFHKERNDGYYMLKGSDPLFGLARTPTALVPRFMTENRI